jgi:hypothetical protein
MRRPAGAGQMSVDQQLWLGKRAPEAGKLKPVTNDEQIFCKPRDGGLWTSTFNGEGKSAWQEWCEAEDYDRADLKPGWVLFPSPDATVYTIGNYEDLATLHKCHKGTNRPYGPSGPIQPTINFKAVARAYDGIHLTEEGQWETRMTRPLSMYGWDCESTFWFRWCFDKVVKR